MSEELAIAKQIIGEQQIEIAQYKEACRQLGAQVNELREKYEPQPQPIGPAGLDMMTQQPNRAQRRAATRSRGGKRSAAIVKVVPSDDLPQEALPPAAEA